MGGIVIDLKVSLRPWILFNSFSQVTKTALELKRI